MTVTRADLEWWRGLAPTLPWKFASTLAEHPHSYVVRGRALGAEDFTRAVRVIRTFGEPGKFYDQTYIYLTSDDTKWWTMGYSVEETTVINQAEASQTYGEQNAPRTAAEAFTVYDEIATVYDQRYVGPQCQAEDVMVRSLLLSLIGQRDLPPLTLDLGCGTGLLLDLGVVPVTHYSGVDPSQGMLNELVRKHGKVRAGQLFSMTAERWLELSAPEAVRGRYDLVVSLFGSPSYMEPATILALPELLRPGGHLVLMHLEPGYLPDYQHGRLTSEELAPSRDAAAGLLIRYPGYQLHLNHFIVTVLRAGV